MGTSGLRVGRSAAIALAVAAILLGACWTAPAAVSSSVPSSAARPLSVPAGCRELLLVPLCSSQQASPSPGPSTAPVPGSSATPAPTAASSGSTGSGASAAPAGSDPGTPAQPSATTPRPVTSVAAAHGPGAPEAGPGAPAAPAAAHPAEQPSTPPHSSPPSASPTALAAAADAEGGLGTPDGPRVQGPYLLLGLGLLLVAVSAAGLARSARGKERGGHTASQHP